MAFYDKVLARYKAGLTPQQFYTEVGQLITQHEEEIPRAEFARLAGVSPSMVSRWIAMGKIVATNKGLGESKARWYIKRSELEKISQ